MIRVVLVDDHAIVRTGLKAVIGATPDMTVVGEADGGNAAVALLAHTAADVVVSPSPSAIERSITTTSAGVCANSARAALPPSASPTTVMPAAAPITAFSPARTMAWSSTSITRIDISLHPSSVPAGSSPSPAFPALVRSSR